MGYSKENILYKHYQAKKYKRILATFNDLYGNNVTNKDRLIIILINFLYNDEKGHSPYKMEWNKLYKKHDERITKEEEEKYRKLGIKW